MPPEPSARPAESWDDEFEYQVLDNSRSPRRRPVSPPSARTSSPLSSLSWAESEVDDSNGSDLCRSSSNNSRDAINTSRGFRKRQKGLAALSWSSTTNPAANDDEDVKMTAASPGATLKRSPFASSSAPAARRGLIEPLAFEHTGASRPAVRPVAAHARPPTWTSSASSFGSVSGSPSRSSADPSLRPDEGDWSSLSASPTLPMGSGPMLSEVLRSDGQPRRRLKKRSRPITQSVANATDMNRAYDLSHGQRESDDQDAPGHSSFSSSPRQIISRGMWSLSRTFSLGRGKTTPLVYSPVRQPLSSTSPQATLRRFSGFLESRHLVIGPAPLNLDPPTKGYFSPYVASPPPPLPALRHSPSQTYSNGGFHLPTRRGSSSTTSSSIVTSPRIRPKTIASHPVPPATVVNIPPPPFFLTSPVPRPPFPHSKSTPQSKVSLQLARRPDMLDEDRTRLAPTFDTVVEATESRPASRASKPRRKGHRTSSSVNSIPLQAAAYYSRPIPVPAGFTSHPTSSLPSGEPQRSASTPPISGHFGRRNSLSDLRIPSRVASAQGALRERMTAVKEFAAKVEGLKRLQYQYAELQLGVLTCAGRNHLPSAENPCTGTFPIDGLVAEFEPWWEMAEVLVRLAGTNLDEAATAADNRVSSSSTSSSERTRAVTMLARADHLASTTLSSNGPPRASPERWRGSTGRTELSQRQLNVLRGMLTTPVEKERLSASASADQSSSPHACSGSGPPASMHFADPLSHVPTGRSTAVEGFSVLPQQRRASRPGVKGFKDFLRSLRIGAEFHAGDALIFDGEQSTTGTMMTARSGGTLVTVDPSSGPSAARESGRRPSLASIFRFGKDSSSERRPKIKVGREHAGSASRTNLSSPAASESERERMSVDSQRPTTPGPRAGRVIPRSAYSSLTTSSRWKPSVPPPVPPLPPLPIRTAPPNPPAEWPSSNIRPPDGHSDKVELTPESLQPLLLHVHVREVERHCARCLRQLSARANKTSLVSPSAGSLPR